MDTDPNGWVEARGEWNVIRAPHIVNDRSMLWQASRPFNDLRVGERGMAMYFSFASWDGL